MTLRDKIISAAVALAEQRRIPDTVVRKGMDQVVASRLAQERRRPERERAAFWRRAWAGPIAVETDRANSQHYEVPPEFFQHVLGPRRKYSAAYWPEGVANLAAAEDAMLGLTAARAGIEDGDAILDLGCGWGSFTLWAAERYPASTVTAVSNASSQRSYIEATAAERQLDNVEVLTADINSFDPGRRFDRIVSIEMLEHVRNHRAVMTRLRDWINDGGSLFIHVFAHQEYAYPYESEGPASWMADTFFSGGVMPSRTLLPRAAEDAFTPAGHWWLNGTHYSRTLEAWLARLDGNRAAVREALQPVYGDDTGRWLQRWRMFFMACAALFAHDAGEQWGVAHYRFAPT